MKYVEGSQTWSTETSNVTATLPVTNMESSAVWDYPYIINEVCITKPYMFSYANVFVFLGFMVYLGFVYLGI